MEMARCVLDQVRGRDGTVDSSAVGFCTTQGHESAAVLLLKGSLQSGLVRVFRRGVQQSRCCQNSAAAFNSCCTYSAVASRRSAGRIRRSTRYPATSAMCMHLMLASSLNM